MLTVSPKRDSIHRSPEQILQLNARISALTIQAATAGKFIFKNKLNFYDPAVVAKWCKTLIEQIQVEVKVLSPRFESRSG